MAEALLPTGADLRPTGPTATYEAPLPAAAIDALEAALGGREKLVQALVAAPATDDLAYVVGLIADPRMDTRRLSTVCKAGRVTVGELLQAIKAGVYAKMTVQVMAAIADQTPAVVSDVLTRAQPHWVPCPDCKGTLLIRNPRAEDPENAPKVPCRTCVNADDVPTGQILILPDLDRQKLALELAGLTAKKAPLIAVQDNRTLVTDASTGGFSRLIDVTDKLLHARPPAPPVVGEAVSEAVDAEVAPADP